MSTDEEGQEARRPIEPLVGVARDGVALGYQALDLVVTGLREGLRVQRGPRARPPASAAALRARRSSGPGSGLPGGARGGGGASGAGGVAGGVAADLVAIAGEMFKRAGAAADEVGRALPKPAGQSQPQTSIPELAVAAAAGETAKHQFSIWNTHPAALPAVTFSATDLIGAGVPGLGARVTFEPEVIPRIGPGKSATVEIAVAIPVETPAGVYRALVQAEPVDTCAVLELTVTGPGPTAPAPT